MLALMRARAPLVAGLGLALVAGPAVARPASIAPCALGGREPVAAAFARRLAARERTYADRRPAPVRARARRAYAAGAAAWVYGMPTVLLRATVARYPINRLVGVARLAEPSTRVVVARTTTRRTRSRTSTSGRVRSSSTRRTRAAATPSCSSWTRSPTPSPTSARGASAIARRALRSSLRTGRARCRPGCA
jgi:hypothetical protein